MSVNGQFSCSRPKSPSYTVADVIQRFAPAYWVRHAKRITLDQRRALQAIFECRTLAMGGHRYDCACGHVHHAFHSCNHRLCPRCGSSDTEEWVRKQLGKLLPVPYYMVTFTVPADLRSVLRGNREAMELLMRYSSQALAELLADPDRCGFHRHGFFGVYQSWTQDMRFHPHVHFVVPAVGLDEKWRLKRLKNPRFLLHASPLAIRLRTLLVNALHDNDLIDTSAFWELVKIKWNASVDYAGSGENTVKYLGRYIRRSVISDGRILDIKGEIVRIRVKNRDTGTFESKEMDGIEFVRRFLQHALPPRFHRIRYRGFLHARGKSALQWLQTLLQVRLRSTEEPERCSPREHRCPHCGEPMLRGRPMPRAPPEHRNEHFFQSIAA